jgi:DNA (cytosine-5)-methyltransferase 1
MSLFDGSGGFPLAGAMHGIVPVYAAEVEPYPIAVTRSRFPDMRHLGSVTEIKGAELEPVDVVTFGSPCQDLSVAGLQKGIHDGERSNLFFQAVRIIKELRDKDARTGRTNEHIRPRFAVWENVPGAYSSNGGHDFQAVLQALAEVADPDVSIPFPEKGKWTKAGCIVGDGWSIAWRTLDAQFFGLAQRRKRIYLVADFGSECAGEILFEREGMSGHSEPSAAQGQGTAEDSQGSAGGSGETIKAYGIDHAITTGGNCTAQGSCVYEDIQATLKASGPHAVCYAVPYALKVRTGVTVDSAGKAAGFDGYNADLTGEKSSTLGVNCGMSTGRNGVILKTAAFMGGQGAQAGSIAYTENCSPTLRATESGSNQVPDVVYAINSKQQSQNVALNISNTLGANDYKEPQIVCCQAYSFDSLAGNSMKSKNPHSGCRRVEIAKTLDTSNCNPSNNQGGIAVVETVYALQGNGIDRADTARCNGAGWKEDTSYTLNTIDRHAVAYTIDGRNAVLNTEKSGTLQAKPNGGFSHNFINPVVYDARGNGDGETRTCLTGDHENRVTDYTAVTVFPKVTGALCANSHPGSYTGHDAFNDMLPVVPSAKPPRKWIVRRLTPTECARLQGFPDMHGHPDHKDSLTDEEYAFWLNVRNTHAMINGRAQKQYTREQMLKWYNGLHTDSAEYKMWGNGIALPCAAFVLGQIAIMDGGAKNDGQTDYRFSFSI